MIIPESTTTYVCPEHQTLREDYHGGSQSQRIRVRAVAVARSRSGGSVSDCVRHGPARTNSDRMIEELQRADRHCQENRLLDQSGFGVGYGHGSNLVSAASLSPDRHPARRLVVSSFHPKLSRCRGAASPAWARHLL